MLRDKRPLLELAAESSAARPDVGILGNSHFRLQLCALALQNGLLHAGGAMRATDDEEEASQ